MILPTFSCFSCQFLRRDPCAKCHLLKSHSTVKTFVMDFKVAWHNFLSCGRPISPDLELQCAGPGIVGPGGVGTHFKILCFPYLAITHIITSLLDLKWTCKLRPKWKCKPKVDVILQCNWFTGQFHACTSPHKDGKTTEWSPSKPPDKLKVWIYFPCSSALQLSDSYLFFCLLPTRRSLLFTIC